MADAVLKVVAAGPLVTIQDGGRPGFMRFGVAASGPMDRKAFAIANRALGNAPGAPGIEISLGGLGLDCVSGSVALALTGGGFLCQIDGAKHHAWGVFTLAAGQRLTIRPGFWGSWAYLAIAGRLQAPVWLGSVATHAPSGLGGGVLRAGDTLHIAQTEMPGRPARALPCPVWARPRQTLHAVLGPQDRYFGTATIETFAASVFRLSAAYDRMGIRIEGPRLAPAGALSIPSQPVLRGSVQVSGDGAATILMADHQTTGGYPKIATILDDDLDGLAQCRPGQPIGFRLISAQEAVALARFRARLAFGAMAARG